MKQYTKSSKIGRTKLTKNDLSELVALINSGIDFRGISAIKEDVEITAYLSNLNIREYGLENFLRHTDLPRILDFIVFERRGWSESRDIDKTVHLLLGRGASILTVNGQDQTWVLGKHKQLTDYIKSKRPSLWFISMNVSYIILGGIIALSVIILTEIFAIYLKNGLNKINPLLPLAILPLLILLYGLRKIKNTIIVLQETESFWDKYGTIITIVLSVLTLLATVVIGVIQINQK